MTEHGGNLLAAAAQFGKEHAFLDFSANINPFGVPKELIERLHAAVESDLIHYPDPNCTELSAAFATMHRLDGRNVLCGNGASELIKLAVDYVVSSAAANNNRKARILVVEPAFGEYSANALLGGAEVAVYYTQECDGFKLNLNLLQSELASGSLGAIDALMIGNPNNPTSTLIDPALLAQFTAFCGEQGIVVLVDEAFIELTVGGEANSLSGYGSDLSNLIIIRAVTKSLAVPGLRLGYALAPQGIIECMKQKQITWSVNALAQCVGGVLPQLTSYRQQMATWLKEELPWMYGAMREIDSLTVFEPKTNFMLCKLNDKAQVKNGGELYEKLAKQGILIRKSTFDGLSDRFFRIAIRSREDNLRLIAALKSVLCVQ